MIQNLGAGVLLLGCLCGPPAWAQGVGDLDAFFRSVTDGRVEVVKQGLSAHPDWKDAELFLGIRPVYRASVVGRDEVLAILLEAGADVNAVTDRGTHPLHAAAQNGYDKIMDRLLAAGATVDAANDAGQTPLFYAVRFGHPEMAEKLIARGASTQKVDKGGRTALHFSAGMGLLDSTRLLLANGAGADLNLVDHYGYSPLGLCRTWKRNEFAQVAKELEAAGAQDLRPQSAWDQEAQEVQEEK